MWSFLTERLLRRALIAIALGGLVLGFVAAGGGRSSAARVIWAVATLPVVVALAVSIVRDLLAGRMGVDAVAMVSMSGALLLGESLAAVVVAVMYAGGNVLEDFAVARAERELTALVDRAPRVARRREGDRIVELPVDAVAIGDELLVRPGEIIPVDGVLLSAAALIDESALTGEPLPISRRAGESACSGTLNVGEAFEIRAVATAGESTYAAIVRLVTAAQTAKAPLIRLADRYALLLLPATLSVAGLAWIASGDAIRGLAVLVAATPCPLILAAPVAVIAGVSQAARHGILVKGGGPLEALARVHTVIFDKTGTLTVGGARLAAVETAPGADPDDVLRYAASLEQASQHVVAKAIVTAASGRGLAIDIPQAVKESFGSGLDGMVGSCAVRVGSQQWVFGKSRPPDWALRALRRASWRSALAIFVAIEGRPVGALLLADELRRETPRAVAALRSAGVARIMMVTGDRPDAAETIGAALDLDVVLADRVPADKVEAVNTEQRLNPTLMVGDGINDAPALAAADVGMAMGARGASASSEAADVVLLVDRLDHVPKAIGIAHRSRAIALQSILVGMGLSGLAMAAAAAGALSPVAAALIQEAIDVAVILNALRALGPGRDRLLGRAAPAAAGDMQHQHHDVDRDLDRLREISDALDDADAVQAKRLILEADRIVASVVEHERQDEISIYPRVSKLLPDNHGLSAMSRAHREILHLARSLSRIAEGLAVQEADRYLVRDAQRVIESIEALVRIHNAQEEDIYGHVGAM